MVKRLPESSPLGSQGPWGPASRWWKGTEPEWDVVSESLGGERLLLGEAKWSARPLSRRAMERARSELLSRPAPSLPALDSYRQIVRVLFVPEVEGGLELRALDSGEPLVVTVSDLLRS